MATEFQLDIVTPMRGVFSGKVLQVVLPEWDGQEGVLPEHDAKLAVLRGGVCSVYTVDGETRYAIGQGFVEVDADRVTVLTEVCQAAGSIDKSAAQADLRDLEAQLAQVDWTSEEANGIRNRIEVAQARIEA